MVLFWQSKEEKAVKWKAAEMHRQQVTELGGGEDWQKAYPRKAFLKDAAAGIRNTPARLASAVEEYESRRTDERDAKGPWI